MTGFTNLEGVVRQMRTLQATGQNFLIEDFTQFIPYDLDIESGSDEESTLSARIKEFYYGDDEPSRDDLMPGLDLQTDYEFAFPAYYSSIEHVKTSSEPVYVYYYTANASWNNVQFLEYPGKYMKKKQRRPTELLTLGIVRTMLFSYIFCKQFILMR